MMNLFIEPRDVLLFRDGRPFAAGEDHRAVSLFPPMPLTLQGALRSARLLQSTESLDHQHWSPELKAEIGAPDDFGALQMRGPFIAGEEGGQIVRYFPLPADVLLDECSHPVTLAPLPRNDSSFESNKPADAAEILPLWRRSAARLEEAKGWLSETELQRYLTSQPFAITPEHELFMSEPRFHVGLDGRSKRPREDGGGGHLFQIEFVRPCPHVGLWVSVDGLSLNDSGLLQLGGEARAAAYRRINDPLPADQRKRKGRFKLYFASPAYFAAGWQPDDWGRFITGGIVRLIAAAVPRALAIGGFDVARKQHKPMRRFVPAGSVYFFESDDEVTVAQSITDNDGTQNRPMRLGQIGFGQVMIGEWNYV